MVTPLRPGFEGSNVGGGSILLALVGNRFQLVLEQL